MVSRSMAIWDDFLHDNNRTWFISVKAGVDERSLELVASLEFTGWALFPSPPRSQQSISKRFKNCSIQTS